MLRPSVRVVAIAIGMCLVGGSLLPLAAPASPARGSTDGAEDRSRHSPRGEGDGWENGQARGQDRLQRGEENGPDSRGLTVHEWGTFTTVAGEDGQAVQWLPLGGPSDLPCFVYSFQNSRQFKFGLPEQTRLGPTLDYQTARAALKGTVRMETPVLYFYASRATTVDVKVNFQKGLFTEWYPNATVSQWPSYQNLLVLDRPSLAEIAWRDVEVRPSTPRATPEFRREAGASHYYAARETDAAPIVVNGEDEKFLFYRGVAGFASPIAATLADNGQIAVSNRSGGTIPRVILFTKRGARLGYRVHGTLAPQAQVVLNPPSTTHTSTTQTFAALRNELEQLLVSEGLYLKEAQAMVETWRDSWFEDGTRVFYIVPSVTVDTILPLQIDPSPVSVVRVFVGRMDVITPADVTEVTTAFATGDRTALEARGRLLGPIADRILARTSAPEDKARLQTMLNAALTAHATRVGQCDSGSPLPTASAGGSPFPVAPLFLLEPFLK